MSSAGQALEAEAEVQWESVRRKVRLDVGRLLQDFRGERNLSFVAFKKAWSRSNYGEVHHVLRRFRNRGEWFNSERRRSVLRHFFGVLLDAVCEPGPPSTRIGALYALHCISATQQLRPRELIRMDLPAFDEILRLRDESKKFFPGQTSCAEVVRHLCSGGALSFSAFPYCKPLFWSARRRTCIPDHLTSGDVTLESLREAEGGDLVCPLFRKVLQQSGELDAGIEALRRSERELERLRNQALDGPAPPSQSLSGRIASIAAEAVRVTHEWCSAALPGRTLTRQAPAEFTKMQPPPSLLELLQPLDKDGTPADIPSCKRNRSVHALPWSRRKGPRRMLHRQPALVPTNASADAGCSAASSSRAAKAKAGGRRKAKVGLLTERVSSEDSDSEDEAFARALERGMEDTAHSSSVGADAARKRKRKRETIVVEDKGSCRKDAVLKKERASHNAAMHQVRNQGGRTKKRRTSDESSAGCQRSHRALGKKRRSAAADTNKSVSVSKQRSQRAPLATERVARIVIIRVGDPKVSITPMRVRSDTEMSTIFNAYARSRGFDVASCSFTLRGIRVLEQDTVEMLEIGTDEIIACSRILAEAASETPQISSNEANDQAAEKESRDDPSVAVLLSELNKLCYECN